MIKLNRQIYSIYKNVKINQSELPTYYPLRYTPNRTHFEEVDMLDYDLQILQGELPESMLDDLQGLNSYIISKLGKSQKSKHSCGIIHTLERLYPWLIS